LTVGCILFSFADFRIKKSDFHKWKSLFSF
jgi:hypothetical protein